MTPVVQLRPGTRHGVVVAHPGRQHVYETVLAAQESGILRAFATSVFLGDGRATSRVLAAAARVPVARRLVRGTANRTRPEIDGASAVTFPGAVLAATAVRALPLGGGAVQRAAEHTDRAIADWLRRLDPPPAIVHAFEGVGLETLRAARAAGALTVLDAPSAHEHAVAELAREGVASPDSVTRRVHAERELADRVLVASAFVARELERQGVDRQRIAIVPYGVDTDVFRPAAAPDAARAFRVLFAGTSSPLKGLRYLLEAWERLRADDAELVLAGGAVAEARPLLRAHRGTFRAVGRLSRSELAELLRRVDVLVLPSLSDGFGLVVAEALASAVPVIATTATGFPVPDGRAGFVVPPRDVDALCDRLALLRREPELRAAMGAEGRRLVERDYRWSDYREGVAGLYRSLVGGAGDATAREAAGGAR